MDYAQLHITMNGLFLSHGLCSAPKYYEGINHDCT